MRILSAMRAPLTWQRSATYTGMVTACMHVIRYCSCIYKARSLGRSYRTANLTTIQLITPHTMRAPHAYSDLRCFTHGSLLERLYTRYSGSGDSSRLCIRVAAQNMNCTLQLTCVWLLGVARGIETCVNNRCSLETAGRNGHDNYR